MQCPDHWYGRYQNQNVSDYIGHCVGHQECMMVDSFTGLKRVPVVTDGPSLEKTCNQTSHGPDDDIYPNDIKHHMVARALEDAKVE